MKSLKRYEGTYSHVLCIHLEISDLVNLLVKIAKSCLP